MSDVLGGIKVNNLIWGVTILTLGSLYFCVIFIIYFSGKIVINKTLQLWTQLWNILIQSSSE